MGKASWAFALIEGLHFPLMLANLPSGKDIEKIWKEQERCELNQWNDFSVLVMPEIHVCLPKYSSII